MTPSNAPDRERLVRRGLRLTCATARYNSLEGLISVYTAAAASGP